MRCIIIFACMICGVQLSAIYAQAAVTYLTVALPGESAPGTSDGVKFQHFNTPIINNAGQVAFRGFLTGVGIDSENDAGLWGGVPDSLELFVRKGAEAPGAGDGIKFGNPFAPALNSSGHIAFTSELAGPSIDAANDRGIWTNSTGSLELVAREGDNAPGTAPGIDFDQLPVIPLFNDAGQIGIRSSIVGSGVNSSNDVAIWVGGPGSLTMAAREGSAAPNIGPGVEFKILRGLDSMNDAGVIATTSTLDGPNVSDDDDFALWVGDANSLMPYARQGDAAPGAGAGANFVGANTPAINSSGQVTFYSTLVGPSVDASNNSGIWVGAPDSLEIVAREGEHAPGTEEGVVFSNFDRPVLSGSGIVAFKGFLTGPGVNETNDSGIWLGEPGSLTLIAREGDTAPGTSTGIFFGEMNIPLINNTGQIAFRVFLKGPGAGVGNNKGIWATDSTGVLNLIAREDGLFDVSNDPLIEDLRPIGAVDISNGLGFGAGDEDGRTTPFNDNGQLTFRLIFKDGSGDGIFVANVPEPAIMGLLLLGCTAIMRRGV